MLQILDREEVLHSFISVVSPTDAPLKPLLYIRGESQMGKTHLLRVLRQYAVDSFRARCSLTDLRNSQYLSEVDILDRIVSGFPFIPFENYQQKQADLLDKTSRPVSLQNIISILSKIEIVSKSQEKQVVWHLTNAFLQDIASFNDSSDIDEDSDVDQYVQPLVFLFDHFEGADKPVQEWLLNSVISRLLNYPRICVVIAGIHLDDPPSGIVDYCQRFTLDRVTLEDSARYCDLVGYGLSLETIEFAWKNANGKPGIFIGMIELYRGRPNGYSATSR